jgi:hypothetical protein
MKPFTFLLIILFFSGLSATVAQKRVRDMLFPEFEQDIAKEKQKQQAQLNPKPDSRSFKERTFTDYRPQTSNSNTARSAKIQHSAGKPLSSDMSSADAAKANQARLAALPKPVAPPLTQDGESAPKSSEHKKQ